MLRIVEDNDLSPVLGHNTVLPFVSEFPIGAKN